MRHRRRNASIALVALAAIAVGTTTFAQDEGEEEPPPSEPGTPYVDPDPGLTEGDVPENIVTSSSTFDPSILTKFVPGDAFVSTQGDAGLDDKLTYGGGTCVSPSTISGGAVVVARASLELPDGARIKQLIFYGRDDAATDITVTLQRTNMSVLLLGAGATRSDEAVTSFNTSGQTGTFALASTDNLNETVGSFSSGGFPFILGFNHRFHSIDATMTVAAGATHVLCGVEVQYQVPVSTADPGTVFHPIDPVRAYDSRQAPYAPNNGKIGPNQSRIVSIKDARDTGGNLVAADVIPVGATAITYNITVAEPSGPNFLAVTPGDVGSFTASAINFNGTADIANAGTTKIAADRTIKVWGGDQAGSMHFLIDVTGYYLPPVPPPNMGN
jgi:hypothetical protein